jgi:UDP-N-acetylmuramyl pentapeptide synthase
VRSRKIAEGALNNGMQEENIFQYDDARRAGIELQGMLQAGDVILVKASQGIRAERIVEEIMAEPDNALALLVRQDDEWGKR